MKRNKKADDSEGSQAELIRGADKINNTTANNLESIHSMKA